MVINSELQLQINRGYPVTTFMPCKNVLSISFNVEWLPTKNRLLSAVQHVGVNTVIVYKARNSYKK